MVLMARYRKGNTVEERNGYVVFTVKEVSMDPLGNIRVLVRREHNQKDRQGRHGWQGKRYEPSITVLITPAVPLSSS